MDENIRVLRILIADDEAIFRDTMKKLLGTEPGFVVVGEASSGEETLRLVKLLKPDILLLDWQMPDLSGREILESLSASHIKTRTVVLTAESQEEQATDAFGVGARGLVLKQSSFVVLVQSLRAVMDGRYWILDRSVEHLDGFISRGPAESNRIPPKDYGLTKRELEVVAAVVSGYTNQEIAKQLSISIQTVKHHITSIFDKLGVYTRLELSIFATHHKLIDHPDSGDD
jgi:DNA-binding NarL/FixJ family response regulator